MLLFLRICFEWDYIIYVVCCCLLLVLCYAAFLGMGVALLPTEGFLCRISVCWVAPSSSEKEEEELSAFLNVYFRHLASLSWSSKLDGYISKVDTILL